MPKVVLFGLCDIASLAHFYLSHDSPHKVVAFCFDQQYLPPEAVSEGKPVVAPETVETVYPHSFIGVNATTRNGLRIAQRSLISISMSASVVKETQDWGVYKGVPARQAKVLSKDLDF